MYINKLHSAQQSCLHEDGINYQIRVTSFIPLWGRESWNGKPGIPKRNQKLWPSDEALTFKSARTRPTQAWNWPKQRSVFKQGCKNAVWELNRICFLKFDVCTRLALIEQHKHCCEKHTQLHSIQAQSTISVAFSTITPHKNKVFSGFRSTSIRVLKSSNGSTYFQSYSTYLKVHVSGQPGLEEAEKCWLMSSTGGINLEGFYLGL